MDFNKLEELLQKTNNASIIKIYIYTQIYLNTDQTHHTYNVNNWDLTYLQYLKEKTTISEKNLYRYLNKLVEFKLIKCPNKKGDYMKYNLSYTINFYEDCVNPNSDKYDPTIKPEYVYAYYFPQDKRLAELENKKVWPVKIGKTTSDPVKRIQQQLSESTLTQPIICFVACVSNCTYYETELHHFYRDRHSTINGDNGGTEWFYLDPNELITVIGLL